MTCHDKSEYFYFQMWKLRVGVACREKEILSHQTDQSLPPNSYLCLALLIKIHFPFCEWMAVCLNASRCWPCHIQSQMIITHQQLPQNGSLEDLLTDNINVTKRMDQKCLQYLYRPNFYIKSTYYHFSNESRCYMRHTLSQN